MEKWLKVATNTLLCSVVVTAQVLSVATATPAQSRRMASLGEMRCSTLGDVGQYKATNRDITSGRQIVRAVSYLNGQRPGIMTGRQGVLTSRPAGVACSLAAPTEAPRYRTLTLAFGFADNSRDIDYIRTSQDTALRLSIYTDGNYVGSQTVRPGDLFRVPVDVQGTRSVALEAECLNGAKRHARGIRECPVLYFLQDTISLAE